MFRLAMAIFTALCWGLFLWLASHESDLPAVFDRYSPAYFLFLVPFAILALGSLLLHTPMIYRRLYGSRHGISTVVVSTLIALAGAEIMIRILDPLDISYYEETRRYHLEKVPDDLLVYKHRPGLDTVYQKVPVKINNLGLRDREITVKADDELRILVLGDSVTFGWGVRARDSFPEQLEQAIARNHPGPVNVINSGVGGYNTEQQASFARLMTDDLQPDLLVLLYVTNDIEINEPPFDPWSDVSPKGKNPVMAIQRLIWHSRLHRLTQFAIRINRQPRDRPPDRTSAGWRRSMAALEELAHLSRNRSIPFVVVMYRLQDSQFSRGLATDISSRATEFNFTYQDSLPWLSKVDRVSITNSVVDARHPNAAGHALLAKGLYDLLVSRGLL